MVCASWRCWGACVSARGPRNALLAGGADGDERVQPLPPHFLQKGPRPGRRYGRKEAQVSAAWMRVWFCLRHGFLTGRGST